MKPKRRSLLRYLVLAFGLSLTFRLAIHADMAVAVATTAPSADTVTAQHCLAQSPDILVEALKKRENEIAARETSIAARIAEMEAAETNVQAKLQELTAAEERLAATISRARNASENDVAKLTAVYEVMGPEGAAKLFAEMEPNFAAGFIARMNPDAAAKVLAGLEPHDAYAISLVLAGRNASVPAQ